MAAARFVRETRFGRLTPLPSRTASCLQDTARYAFRLAQWNELAGVDSFFTLFYFVTNAGRTDIEIIGAPPAVAAAPAASPPLTRPRPQSSSTAASSSRACRTPTCG